MKYIAIPVLAIIAYLGYTMTLSQESQEQETTKATDTKELQQQQEIANDLLVEFYADTDLDAQLIPTESGLQYAVLKEGTGTESPDITSTVEVHYHGMTMDGEIFDSSVLRDETIEFPLRNLIAGWQEGIPLMTVGSKYRLVVPAVLAYGETGSNPLAGKVLIFDIELFSFE